jgi:hypothetical protein
MNAYKLAAALLAGFIIAAGCGDSDETGNTSGGSNSGTGGGAADASTSTGGTSTGGTSTGGTSTGGTSTGGGAADAGAQCATRTDCTAPLYCVNGSCVECATNSDCTAPLICVSGGCVECGANTDCTAPEQCINGTCLGCVDNSSCPSGQFCVGGTCTSGCSTSNPCPSGEECVGGVCLGTECTTNADCTAPDQCVLGRCGSVVTAACQGHIYQCGDGLDNDNDGLTDMNDPDCLGPCSNNETNFHNCIPGGGNNACAADCYFDQDSGSGNDQCYWDHRCDPLETPEGQTCPYTCKTSPGCDLSTQSVAECVQACDDRVPSLGDTCAGRYDTQPAQCETVCGPLTPNGCDCFGCCDVLGDGDYRFMGSTSNDQRGDCNAATCTLDAAIAKDDTACKKCTPVAACLNPCEPANCECCLAGCNLPDSCNPAPGTGGTGGSGGTTGGTGGSGGTCPTPLCPAGVQSCGVSCLPPCGTGFYCSTGCCRPIPA